MILDRFDQRHRRHLALRGQLHGQRAARVLDEARHRARDRHRVGVGRCGGWVPIRCDEVFPQTTGLLDPQAQILELLEVTAEESDEAVPRFGADQRHDPVRGGLFIETA